MTGIFKPSRRIAVGATPSLGYDIEGGFDETDDSGDTSASPAQPNFAAPIDTSFNPSQFSNPFARDVFRDDIQTQQRQKAIRLRQQQAAQSFLEKQQKEQAAAEKKARNNKREYEFRSRGVEFYTDASGDIQPVLDEKTGQPVFKERVSEVQYDALTGRPFQIKRDRLGNETEVDPDKDAVIGENPNDPNDKFIYRQNKHQAWEAIDPEEGLRSADPRVRVASAKFLYGREIRELERQKHEVTSQLNRPDFPKALTDKERGELETEVGELGQPFPRPEAKSGVWFGLGKKEVDQSELDEWRVLEEDRKKRLAEAEGRLRADDERKELAQRAWEIEQKIFAVKQGGPGGLMRRRLEERAQTVKDTEIAAQAGEIEREAAEVSQGIEANNARLESINEELRRGVTGERAAELRSEAAGIMASNRQLQERGEAANQRGWELNEVIRLKNQQALDAQKNEQETLIDAPDWAKPSESLALQRDERGLFVMENKVQRSRSRGPNLVRNYVAVPFQTPDGQAALEVRDRTKLSDIERQAEGAAIYMEPESRKMQVPYLRPKTSRSRGASQEEIGYAEEVMAHNRQEEERIAGIRASRKTDAEIDELIGRINESKQRVQGRLQSEIEKILENTRSGVYSAEEADKEIEFVRERVLQEYAKEREDLGQFLESARSAFWEGRISLQQARAIFEAAGVQTEAIPDVDASLKGVKSFKERERILREYENRYAGQVLFNLQDHLARVGALEMAVEQALKNERFLDWWEKNPGMSERDAALEWLSQDPSAGEAVGNFFREIRSGINSYIPAIARIGADLSTRMKRAFDEDVRKEWAVIEAKIREQGKAEGLSDARIAARVKRARNEQYLDLINQHSWYEFAKAFDEVDSESKDYRLRDSFSGKLGQGLGSALQFAAATALTGGIGGIAGRGAVGAGLARYSTLSAGQRAGIAAASNMAGKVGTVAAGGLLSTDSIQQQVRELGGDPGWISYGLGVGLGATELVGATRSLQKIMGHTSMKNYVMRMLSPASGKRLVWQSIEEGGQEIFQGTGEALTVVQFYDGLKDAWKKDNLGGTDEEFAKEFGERPDIIGIGTAEEGAIGGAIGILFEAIALGSGKMRYARARAQNRQNLRQAEQEWAAAKENFTPEDFAARLTVERKAVDPNAPEVTPEQVTVTLDLIGDVTNTSQIDKVQDLLRAEIAKAEKAGDADVVVALEAMLADQEALKKEMAERRVKDGLSAVEDIESAKAEAQAAAQELEANRMASPEVVQSLKARVKEAEERANLGSAIAKLATGKPLASLTTEELAAAGLVPDKNGGYKSAVGLAELAKARSEGAEILPSPVQTDRKGNPIITDRAVAQIGRTMPGVAGLVKMSESEARQNFEKADLGDVVPSSTPNAPQPGAETSTAPGATPSLEVPSLRGATGTVSKETLAPAPRSGVWKARGLNGTEVSIPAAEAGTQAEAERKLASRLPAGEMLDIDSIEPPSKVDGKSTVPKVPRGTQLREQMAPMIDRADPAVRPRMRGLVDVLAAQLDVYGAVFPGGFELVRLSRGGGLAYNAASKVLEVDLNRLARQVDGVKNPAALVQAMMREEVIHRAATDVLGREEIIRLWEMLPERLKGKVRDSYWQDRVQKGEALPEDDPFTMGHEFIRMLTQDKFFNQVTESTEIDDGLIAYLRELLEKIGRQLRSMLADPAITDAATRQAVREAEGLVARRLSDLGVKKEVSEGGQKQFSSNNDSTNYLSFERGTTSADNRGGLLGIERGTGMEEVSRQTLSGRGTAPVSVEAGEDVALAGEETSRKLPPARFSQLGDVGVAYTDNNDPVEYRWALAELDDLVISNEDSGAINPRYPQELQPRDRSTAGSQAQVNDIARNANFDRLSFSESVGNGAPIVGPNDGVAESGNGRLMGLRRAYNLELPSIKVYREKLAANAEKFGLDGSKVAAMKKPVLVRVRQTTLDRRKFVEVANVSNVAPMREMEIARKDAANLSLGLFELFNPDENGNILTAGNQDFIRAFVLNVIPQTERAAIVDSRGGLSQSGLRRIRNALFVYAYGDSPEAMNALGRMAEDIEADGRNITNALIAAAPVFARQNAAIKNGSLHDAGISGDLVAAAQALMEIRARGERVSDYLQQGQLIDDGVTPLQREILQFLDQNGRSAKRILETLRRYAVALDAAGDPRQEQLLQMDAPTKESLWNLAKKPNAEEPILQSGKRAVAAPNWMRIYNRLFNMERAGARLNESQRSLLERAERELGQILMFAGEGYGPAPRGEGVNVGIFDEGQDQGRLFAGQRSGEQLDLFDTLSESQRREVQSRELDLFGNPFTESKPTRISSKKRKAPDESGLRQSDELFGQFNFQRVEPMEQKLGLFEEENGPRLRSGLGQSGTGYTGSTGSSDGGRQSLRPGGREDLLPDETSAGDMGGDQAGGEPTGSGQRDRGVSEWVLTRPPAGSPDRNHVIREGDTLAPRGDIARIRANIDAIRLLRRLEEEGRNPTVEEKKILAQYVGWGGLPQVFDDEKAAAFANDEHRTRRSTADVYERYGPAYYKIVEDYRKQAQAIENWHEKWGKWHAELKELLTPEEYSAAAASTLNAHYTSPEVIRAMWDMAQRLGFRGGSVLEPAGGVGHFFGLMPEGIAESSQLSAVELDSLTGRILTKLYPEADVQVTGFQDAKIPDNSVDLAISNVPFANISIFDPEMEAAKAPKFSLHNYFFAKALQKVRPGGLIAFITTSNTMDANVRQRKWLAERSELIGAIRLPNTAFNENANTEVTTDILFLRKPDGTPPVFDREEWASTAEAKTRKGEPIQINEYFVRHPEMILGELDNDGKMYGRPDEKGQMTVHPFQGKPLAESLSEAAERLPANVIFTSAEAVPERNQRSQQIWRETRGNKVGTLSKLDDGSIVISGVFDQNEDILKPKNRKLAEDFIALRDTLNALYESELNPDATDSQIEGQRELLNRRYDAFVRDHGNLHKFVDLLGIDPDFYRLLGTEIEQKPENAAESIRVILSRKKRYRKGDVFTKRVLTPRREPEKAETVEDALGISLGWRGRIDVDFMARLLSREQAEVENELLVGGMAFRNPESGLLETREEYLSGNVRKKLRVAEIKAAEDPAYGPNVEALQRVQPEDVKIADIKMKLGSAWIPADVVQRFARQIFDSEAVDVIYHPGRGEMIEDSWEIRYGGKGTAATGNLTAAMSQIYGTNRMSGLALLEKALNLQQPEIYDTNNDGKTRIFNPTATTQAKVAMQKIKDAFDQWVQRNPDVQEELAKVYNEVNNSHVLRQYDGQFLQFPWMAAGFDLFSEKKNVVWRAIQDGRMLIAHGVGGGKTIIGTSIAMELKRLGQARKPLIVVHNATLEQFAGTINAMAPTARVLVARKKDLEGKKRKEFMAKVAAGDWDAVVMAHSSFDMIPDDPAYEAKLINELQEELRDAITEMGGNPDGDARKTKDPTVKEMQKQLARLGERMKELQDRKRDDVLNFQELGIDALILDEAHLYKKIPFVTKLRRIAGIDNGASKRGTALMTKVRFIQEKNKGRNVFTMTGTPVTNTLGESWNMIRLVAPDLLKEFNVENFDRFVSTFADIVNSAELRANGAYKQIDRLAALANLPEWNRFFRLGADVKMGEDMQVRGRPEIKGGKPELVAVERTPQVSKFTDFIKGVIDWYDNLDGKQKKEFSHLPLVTYNAAKMAAIDIRLVDPQAKDEPGSKVNIALKKVVELYRRTNDYLGTQVIFADSFRPLKSTALDISAADLEPGESLDDDEKAEREADAAGGFNLYRDMKAKLVASGIPEAEIAIISDYDTDKKKERLFEQVNEGQVRIVIGSTQRLGTGVNMQRRMIAAHHLDVPWTPAELEQRDGRVYRQGNIHSELGVPVEIYRYGMKDTLDAALWQKLETKERFIKQALSGKMNSRSIEDDTGLLNLAEQKAVLSGPLGMRKFEADQRVRELQAEERAWRMSVAEAGQNASKASKWRRIAEGGLAKARRTLESVKSWSGPVSLEIGGRSAKGAEQATELLKSVFEERLSLIRSIANPSTSPRANSPMGKAFFNGTEIELGRPSINERLGESKPENRWRIEVPILFNGEPIGSAQSAGWVLRRLQEFPASVEETIVRLQREIDRYQKQEDAALKQMEGAFPKQAELEAALLEQSEVMRLVSEKPGEQENTLNDTNSETIPSLASGERARGQIGIKSIDRDSLAAYLQEGGASAQEAKQESERISRTLEQSSGGRVAEAGGYIQSDLFIDSPSQPGGPDQGRSKAGKKAALAINPAAESASADLIAGLQGDWEALAREVAAKGRASSIFQSLVSREIPTWDVRGSRISSPQDVLNLIAPIRSPFFESLKVAILDGKDRVVASKILFVGSLNESVADPKALFGELALLREQTGKNYSRIIFSHNHPSGDPTPSTADNNLTRRIVEIANLAKWTVVDHVITNGEQFFSFREAGIIYQPNVATDRTESPTPPPTPPSQQPSQQKWEVVPRSKLQRMDAFEYARDLAKHLRNANPDAAHIIYLSTKLTLIGVERIDVNTLDSEHELTKTLIAGAAREGAYAFIVDAPSTNSFSDKGPSFRDFDRAKRIKDIANAINLQFLDLLHIWPDGNSTSYKEKGFVLESPSFMWSASKKPGEQENTLNDTNSETIPSLASGERARGQLMFDFGLYRNPGEFDFTDRGKAPGDLVKENMGLATAIANDFSNISGVEKDDVIQQARVALVKAAKAYDPSRGVRFGVYAGRAIRNELSSLYGKQSRRTSLEGDSLDRPLENAPGETVMDTIAGENAWNVIAPVERNETRDILKGLLAKLPERPRAIVEGFMAGESGEEIAARMGITRQAVNASLQGALAVMRQRLRERGFKGQEDGVLFSGERDDENSPEDLFAELNRELPSQEEIDELRQKAAAEPIGQRTIGQPRKANYAEDDATRVEINVVQQMREEARKREEESAWIAEARKRIETNRDLAKKEILQKAMNPAKFGTFTAVDVKTAQLLVPELMREAYRSGDKTKQREAFALAWAYDAGGSDQARAFAARRDPFKTPAERHMEFLTKMISTPTAEQRKWIAQAATQEEKAQRLEQAQNERLAKIEKALADMGVTLEDIFAGEASVVLKSATFVQNAIKSFGKEEERKVIRLTLDGFSDKEIAKKTRLSIKDIQAVQDRMDEILAKRLGEYAERGFTAADLETLDISELFAGEKPEVRKVALTPDQKAKIVAEMLRKIRPDREVRNSKKLVKRRKPRRKLENQAGSDAEREAYENEQPWEYVGFDPGNQDQVIRVARLVQAADANAIDMFYEAWINSILSGPQTQVVNIMGNAANALWDFMVQRPMEAAINAALVKDADAASFGELRYLFRGAIPGIIKGWQAGIRAWNAEHDFFESEKLNQQIEFEEFDKAGDIKVTIPGKTGRFIRISGRALMFMDSFFKYATGQMEAGAQAYRLGKAQGLEGQALEDFIRSEINLPGSMSWQRAVAKAKDLTFQTALPKDGIGGVVRKIGEIRRGKSTSIGGRLMELFLGMTFPFIRTPYNIFRIGLRKSPLGALNVAYHIGQGFYSMKKGRPFVEGYSKAQLVSDLAEQTLAWVGMALLWGMVEGDGEDDDDDKMILITGSRPYGVDRQGERDALNRMYGGPYQIRIGGRNGIYFNYGRIEPFATVLGTVADMVRLAKSRDASDAGIKLFGYFMAQANEKTFLQGFSTITDTIDGAMRDPKSVAKAWERQFLSGLVPNIIRQPLRNLDDFVRDSKYAGLDYTLFAAPNMAEKRVNLYGEDMQKQGSGLSRLFFVSGIKPTETLKTGDRFLVNWNEKNRDAAYWPERPNSSFYRLKNRFGELVEMTPGQIATLDKMAGHAFERKLRKWLTPSRAMNPTEADLKRFKEDLSDARREAKETIARRALLVSP